MGSNENLIQLLIDGNYLKTPRLIEAFRAIDRIDFVPRELRGEAYGNYPLPIGGGQTISQPLTVAFMFELLAPAPAEKILDVGFGSGWTTALLASVVGEKGRVTAVERVPEICKLGESNVRKYNFFSKGIVEFFCGDASNSEFFEKLPSRVRFDKILAGAAAQEEVPEAWKKILTVGGRIVAPIGQSIVVLDKIAEGKFKNKEYSGFSFVPLIRD
jgi:protein-L-isoaspartate(D-aspartate) O-methyltransferase